MMKIVLDLFIIIDICLIISTIWAINYLKMYKKRVRLLPENEPAEVHFFVLLPALKEQRLVKETLEYFSQFESKNLDIVIITSEKEEYQNSIQNEAIITTKMLVDQFLQSHNNKCIKHLHCPYIQGTKSTQLNFARNEIEKSLTEEKNKCYIGVYDFDARPNMDIISELKSIVIEAQYPDVIQQVPINLKNIRDILKCKNAMILLHVFQSNIRTVGIEMSKLLLNTLNIYLPVYCMGSGMYIRLDSLDNNGGFPEPVDDLTLGYRLYLKKLTFAVLPNYVYVDVPNDVKGIVNQDRLIFTGVLSGLEELRLAPRTIRRLLMTFSIFHNILIRTVFPWISLLYIINSFAYGSFTLEFGALLMLPFCMTVVGIYAVLSVEKSVKESLFTPVLLRSVLYSWAWRLMRTVGPIDISIKKLLKKQIKYKKTED